MAGVIKTLLTSHQNNQQYDLIARIVKNDDDRMKVSTILSVVKLDDEIVKQGKKRAFIGHLVFLIVSFVLVMLLAIVAISYINLPLLLTIMIGLVLSLPIGITARLMFLYLKKGRKQIVNQSFSESYIDGKHLSFTRTPSPFSSVVRELNNYSLIDLSLIKPYKNPDLAVSLLTDFFKTLPEDEIRDFVFQSYTRGEVMKKISNSKKALSDLSYADEFLIEEAKRKRTDLDNELDRLNSLRYDYTTRFKQFVSDFNKEERAVKSNKNVLEFLSEN